MTRSSICSPAMASTAATSGRRPAGRREKRLDSATMQSVVVTSGGAVLGSDSREVADVFREHGVSAGDCGAEHLRIGRARESKICNGGRFDPSGPKRFGDGRRDGYHERGAVAGCVRKRRRAAQARFPNRGSFASTKRPDQALCALLLSGECSSHASTKTTPGNSNKAWASAAARSWWYASSRQFHSRSQ